MKQLLLIRHGKSSWVHPGISDHDRPLNQRGEADAPSMARALEERSVEPDRIVTSTAMRAKTTAFLIAERMQIPEARIEEREDLYLAAPGTILRLIQNLDESLDTVFFFGHNPGMHEAVDRLCSGAAVFDFPTLAIGRIQFGAEFWGEVEWNSGKLLELMTPKGVQEG
ncbi:MAG: histidine phosphatase family protein [Verrucomicrobiota bacterium]